MPADPPRADPSAPDAGGTGSHPGQVVQLDRKVCWVRLEDGRTVACPLRGRFFEHEAETTGPIAVGDRVTISLGEEQGVVEEIFPRRTAVVRSAVRGAGKVQVLAANVDLVVVVASLHQPTNRSGLVDRLLVAAESCGLEGMVVLNKSDLCTEEEVESFLAVYRELGYATAAVCARDGRGLEPVRAAMTGRVSLVLGHSGVGKSSVLNALDPSLGLRTGALSRRQDKGMHTTSAASLVDLNFGARVVDSPGVREFALAELEAWQLSGCFPEMREPMGRCHYQPCTHSHEPDCGVRTAVECGEIRAERYTTYLKLLEERDGGGQRMPRHSSF